jgi:hypothetical protein
MRFCFHYRQPFSRQLALLAALSHSARRYGDVIEGEEGFSDVRDVDGLVMFGIGGHSRHVFDAYANEGKRIVFLDKGYTRAPYLRVSVDAFQPIKFLDLDYSTDRFERLGVELQPYRRGGTHILFNGASNKYCLWEKLPYWIEWGVATVAKIAQHTVRPIIYRPRPSHNDPVAVPGAELSIGPMQRDIERAHVAVSYGGNFGWNCAVAGVAHFSIADSIARPISETEWARLDEPRIPTDAERWRWCCAVAHWQYTMEEIEAGVMWRHVREHLDA